MNPYNGNVNIIKDFFRRPLILVTAIFAFLSMIASQVVSLIPMFQFKNNEILRMVSAELSKLGEKYNLSEGEFQFEGVGSFPVFVLIAVAFLLFFIMSRSQTATLKAPLVVFRIHAVVYLVMSIILTVFLILFGVVVIIELPSFAVPAIIIAAGFSAFMLLFSISQLIFVKSIEKSCSSIYLMKSDSAIIFAITAIVSVFVSIAIQIYFTIQMSDQIAPIAANWCSTALSCVSYLLIAVVAFKYYFYLRGITEDLVIEPEGIVDEEGEPFQGINGVGTSKKCANCGKPMGKDDYFCNYCGTTVEK